MWILALDVGTSSVRAIGYDAAGHPLPGADARTAWEPITTSDGGAEFDPETLVAAAASTIDRCLEAAPGPPAAVGASVFWHSLLALDAKRPRRRPPALPARRDDGARAHGRAHPFDVLPREARVAPRHQARDVRAGGYVVRLRRIPDVSPDQPAAGESQHGFGHRSPRPARRQVGRGDARRMRHRPRASSAHRRRAHGRAHAPLLHAMAPSPEGAVASRSGRRRLLQPGARLRDPGA